MKQLKAYISESYNELMHKVSWPSYKELQTSSIIVLVASLLIAVLVFIMDMGFKNIMELIYTNLF
ncbi:MAG: preprotein translocase subunit SecE [Flavobacteriales bacterium]|nr:preprotein translocase subunit SecE [Flavobacteriales bacterium]MCX7649839.1 preprotein translocase subunit SecE [Flavobacteriales bacterium]MDW8432946.1 preprotein translocase subunit SecE [Flavobacteriales bacterium]